MPEGRLQSRPPSMCVPVPSFRPGRCPAQSAVRFRSLPSPVRCPARALSGPRRCPAPGASVIIDQNDDTGRGPDAWTRRRRRRRRKAQSQPCRADRRAFLRSRMMEACLPAYIPGRMESSSSSSSATAPPAASSGRAWPGTPGRCLQSGLGAWSGGVCAFIYTGRDVWHGLRPLLSVASRLDALFAPVRWNRGWTCTLATPGDASAGGFHAEQREWRFPSFAGSGNAGDRRVGAPGPAVRNAGLSTSPGIAEEGPSPSSGHGGSRRT